jgi:hypothetical protein
MVRCRTACLPRGAHEGMREGRPAVSIPPALLGLCAGRPPVKALAGRSNVQSSSCRAAGVGRHIVPSEEKSLVAAPRHPATNCHPVVGMGATRRSMRRGAASVPRAACCFSMWWLGLRYRPRQARPRRHASRSNLCQRRDWRMLLPPFDGPERDGSPRPSRMFAPPSRFSTSASHSATSVASSTECDSGT